MNYSVIFLNTTHEQGVFYPGDATLGISTLQYWLANAGVTSTAAFPEDDSSNILNIEENFKNYILSHSAVLFAISCWSNTFTVADSYADMIRKCRPDALIVGGGAHFHSRKNIEKALHKGNFDMIFRGGADPFFEMCKALFITRTLSAKRSEKGLVFTGTPPPNGIFYLNQGKVNACRHGVLTKAVMPVMHISEEYGEITALFSDECANNCDYCTVFKNKADRNTRHDTEELVIDAYGQLKNVYDGRVRISIMDSSPFLAGNRAETYGTIRRLTALGKNIDFSVLADPYDLDDDFIKFMKQYPINVVFLGRDRINEDHFIGRRLRGVLRTQAELDVERGTINNFISTFADEKREIYIGYIASPYDTPDDADSFIYELGLLTSFSGTLIVQPNLFILNPYGGTTVGRKSEDAAWDIGEFSYPYPNVWYGEDVQMVWLELLRLVVSPVFSTGCEPSVGMSLLRFARKLVFGGDWQPPEDMDSGLYKMLVDFTNTVTEMNLGGEDSITEWCGHLVEIYWYGLLFVAAVKNPDTFSKYGAQRLKAYISQHDIMINLLKKDLELICSKQHEGTWYNRFKK